jgi:hypothetical protein
MPSKPITAETLQALSGDAFAEVLALTAAEDRRRITALPVRNPAHGQRLLTPESAAQVRTRGERFTPRRIVHCAPAEPTTPGHWGRPCLPWGCLPRAH